MLSRDPLRYDRWRGHYYDEPPHPPSPRVGYNADDDERDYYRGIERGTCYAVYGWLTLAVQAGAALTKLFLEDRNRLRVVDDACTIALYVAAMSRNIVFMHHLFSIPEHRDWHPLHPRRPWSDTWSAIKEFGLQGLLGELAAFSLLGVCLNAVGASEWKANDRMLMAISVVDFISLIALVAVVELSWVSLTRVCRIELLSHQLMAVMDVVLQYTLEKARIDMMINYGQDAPYKELHLAAFALLLGVRLRCIFFFEFKAVEPTMSYCRPLTREVARRWWPPDEPHVPKPWEGDEVAEGPYRL